MTLNLNSENKRHNELEHKDSETYMQTKGPLHKARKHLKTFIGRNKKPASLDESEDSGPEDLNLYDDGNTENLTNVSTLPSKKQLHRTDNRFRHRMKTVTSFHKGEICTGCEKSMTLLFSHGYKCTRCKHLFHSKCISQSSRVSCDNVNRVRRTPSKLNKNNKTEQLPITSWNVTRTSEFRDPRDIIVTDVSELQNMDDFIFKKLCQMSGNNEQKDCLVDVVFKRSLREFKFNLISTYSVAAAQDGRLCICYKDLIDNFEQVMQSVCHQENTSQTFPVIMGVNAFRGFLDEFRNLYRNEEKIKSKGKKRKRKKMELSEYMGHKFMAVVINIPTACEICSSFMWLMEKGLVCQ
ncbi:unconventional myosin-IXb-like, partial [Centruroides sculpturatus]|uniref:unconventional myosin-IXb-like n=1 Tax=Centruroides sculpturatus TaxID=218467 RepID=UPI000C6D1CEE